MTFSSNYCVYLMYAFMLITSPCCRQICMDRWNAFQHTYSNACDMQLDMQLLLLLV